MFFFISTYKLSLVKTIKQKKKNFMFLLKNNVSKDVLTAKQGSAHFISAQLSHSNTFTDSGIPSQVFCNLFTKNV